MIRRQKSKFRGTLLSRYLLIILLAFLFIPVIFPLSLLSYQLFNGVIIGSLFPAPKQPENPYRGSALNNMWHNEAKKLDHAQPDEIDRKLLELSNKYPKADLFWVDAEDRVRPMQTVSRLKLPEKWSSADAIAFMKDYRDSPDQFAVVAFIGDKEQAGQGFMVIRVPRSVMNETQVVKSPVSYTVYYGIIMAMFILFIAISWMFFVNIRKRLLRLQSAMTVQGDNDLPQMITIKKADEIGQLEDAFNGMVAQLGSSLEREREEEELRKRLIANLSHDLRTPLTIIRGHMYSLQKEPLTDHGRELLRLTELKISDLGELIDNLLSYSLLTSGRYTLHLEKSDVSRIVRESVAAWYPLWEKEKFEVDVDVQEEPLYWMIDPQWFRRVLDNLFQNVMRHAYSGLYIGVFTETRGPGTAVVITDRGEGMNSSSGGKGAGIGLAIVGFLTREMRLRFDIDSSEHGTRIYLYPE